MKTIGKEVLPETYWSALTVNSKKIDGLNQPISDALYRREEVIDNLMLNRRAGKEHPAADIKAPLFPIVEANITLNRLLRAKEGLEYKLLIQYLASQLEYHKDIAE